MDADNLFSWLGRKEWGGQDATQNTARTSKSWWRDLAASRLSLIHSVTSWSCVLQCLWAFPPLSCDRRSLNPVMCPYRQKCDVLGVMPSLMWCVCVERRRVGWVIYKPGVCLVRQLGLEKLIIAQLITECKALPCCCEWSLTKQKYKNS